MDALRTFARDQVREAQTQLEGLLLLHPEECPEELNVRFWMHRVIEDPRENRRG
jgi:hypothetical protein